MSESMNGTPKTDTNLVRIVLDSSNVVKSVAYSSCGGCGKAKKNVEGDPYGQDEADDPAALADVAAGTEPDESAVEPAGVTCSRNCIEHMKALLSYIDEHVLPAMEPDSAIKIHLEEEFRPVVEELMQDLHSKATEHYPDHDFGEIETGETPEEEAEESPEEEAEETPEEEAEEQSDGLPDEEGPEEEAGGADDDEGMTDEEEEERADEYVRRSVADLRVRNARRKAARMNREIKAEVSAAADHMDEVSDHLEKSGDHPEVPPELGYMHKGYALAHRKQAAALRKAVGYGEEGMPKEHESGGSTEERPANPAVLTDYKRVDEMVGRVDWSAVLKEVRGVRHDLDRARGRR